MMFTKGPTISVTRMLFTQEAPGNYLVQTDIVVFHQGALSSLDARRSRVLSILQTNPRWQLASGYDQPIHSLPRTHNDNDPSIYNSVVYTPK
jgi:hypothetical protein